MRVRLFALIIVTAATLAFAQEPYKDPSQPVETRVADLLSRMTLKEKVGQMTQIDVASMMGEGEWDRGPLNEAQLKNVFEKNQVGSILSGGGAAPVPNTPKAWAEMTNQLQDAALEYSRLGIPYIYGIDAVHGHNNVLGATLYPHNVGLGATWDPALVEKGGGPGRQRFAGSGHALDLCARGGRGAGRPLGTLLRIVRRVSPVGKRADRSERTRF